MSQWCLLCLFLRGRVHWCNKATISKAKTILPFVWNTFNIQYFCFLRCRKHSKTWPEWLLQNHPDLAIPWIWWKLMRVGHIWMCLSYRNRLFAISTIISKCFSRCWGNNLIDMIITNIGRVRSTVSSRNGNGSESTPSA